MTYRERLLFYGKMNTDKFSYNTAPLTKRQREVYYIDQVVKSTTTRHIGPSRPSYWVALVVILKENATLLVFDISIVLSEMSFLMWWCNNMIRLDYNIDTTRQRLGVVLHTQSLLLKEMVSAERYVYIYVWFHSIMNTFTDITFISLETSINYKRNLTSV